MLNELRVDSIEHWRQMCPALTIEGGPEPAEHRFEKIGELLDDLRVEGYVHVPDVLPAAVFEPLRDCVTVLHRSGIPLPFAFVYD